MVETMNLAILIGAGLITISIFTSLISFRVGAPLLLLFLAVGLAAGEDGPGGIHFNDAPVAYFIGSLALAIILFDSGFGTRLPALRAAAWPALVLATVGVAVTAFMVALAAHGLFGFAWLEAMLLGAIVSSTDAAAVFFLLRVGGITIRDRVRSTLEIESGSNDPMAIFMTITLVEILASAVTLDAITWRFLEAFGIQMGLGLALGAVGGLLIVQLVNRITFEPGLYPIVVLSLALCLFAAVAMVGGSGFLAVYVAGLIAGNARLRSQRQLRRFQEGMTWLSQIGMFLTLGLLATPSQFPALLVPALTLALILTFVARPVAVWLCLSPFGFSRNETTFVAWVGLRGAVSILLGILPIVGGLPTGQIFFDIAFLIVLASLLIQGWTIRPMARWLGLIVPPRLGPVERVELELPGTANHELIAYRIAPESLVARGQRIPRWGRPSLIVRDGRSMRIYDAGRLLAGDYVYIFTAPQQVRLLDRLFANPAALDRTDQEFFGDFTIDPQTHLTDLAEAYGLSGLSHEADQTVAGYLKSKLGGRPEVGDRTPFGLLELIVREVTDDGEILSVGLAVEPRRPALPKLARLHGAKDIATLLRRLMARAGFRRALGKDPARQDRPQ